MTPAEVARIKNAVSKIKILKYLRKTQAEC